MPDDDLQRMMERAKEIAFETGDAPDWAEVPNTPYCQGCGYELNRHELERQIDEALREAENKGAREMKARALVRVHPTSLTYTHIKHEPLPHPEQEQSNDRGKDQEP